MNLNVVQSGKRARQCGECRACCTTCAVNELNKSLNTACVHICERGCAIYESRPNSCREYDCAWLQGHLPEKHRPDKSGIVWTFERIEGFDGLLAQAMLLNEHVPMDRIEFLYGMLRQSSRYPLMLQIIPHTLRARPMKKIAGREVRPGVWIAVGEAPE